MSEETQYELALRQELNAATRERHDFLAKCVVALGDHLKSDVELRVALEVLTQLATYNAEVINQITDWSIPYKKVLEDLAAYKKTFAVTEEIAKVRGLIADFEGARAKAQIAEAERLSALARAKEKAMIEEQDELRAIKLHKEAIEAREAAFEAITPTKGLSVGFRWTGELTNWVEVAKTNPGLLHPPTLNKLALQDLLKQFKSANFEITENVLPGIKLTEATKIRVQQ